MVARAATGEEQEMTSQWEEQVRLNGLAEAHKARVNEQAEARVANAERLAEIARTELKEKAAMRRAQANR